MKPRTTNRRTNRTAPTIGADGLDAEPVGDPQVAGVAGQREPLLGPSPGTTELATRDIRPEGRAASGRSVRSRNGCWSSSSSRFLACIAPSWVRRAWTGSTGDRPARPRKIRRMAPAATPAIRIGQEWASAQTSMSTILRMSMKPMNIMNPPNDEDDRRRPAGRGCPAGSGTSARMKFGAAMNRKPARPIGRKPTT